MDMTEYHKELEQAAMRNLAKLKLENEEHERSEKMKVRATIIGGCLGITLKLAVYASIIGLAIHFLF